jgi:two-component system cell cycle sensor histidine kinase/response regulator CckA
MKTEPRKRKTQELHSLLRRQLERSFSGELPEGQPWRKFLNAVNEVYREADNQRELIERSLAHSTEELQQANAEMWAIFQAIPDLLFRLDKDGTILDLKTGSADELLRPMRELVGSNIKSFPIGSIGRQFEEAVKKVAAEKKLVTVEYSIPLQGYDRFYEARLVPLPKEQVAVLMRNVTERKMAEVELFQSQQMLRTVLDTVPQRVFWKDTHSVYVGCNKPFATDCGFAEPSDVAGKTDYETKSASSADLNRADDRQVMESEQPRLNYEEPQVRADGKVGWLRTSKVPLYDENEKVVGVLGTYEDITEFKQLEEQLRQAQKMDAFGQLAAGVAHDFNNVLTVILGNLTLLRQGMNCKADEIVALNQSIAASERAAGLVRQLLMFGRRQMMQPLPLDLNKVVESLAKMLQRLVGEHITLEMRCRRATSPVMADANMLEQALINLAVNARDAMPRGGKLLIEIDTVTIKDPPGESSQPGEFVRCRIADTGVGIAPDYLPHIFEPFFTTKDVGKGTGLGLATVFGIVQQHRGWIKAESELGRGTAFEIFLPRLAQEAPVQTEDHPAEPVSGGCETILLVEDENPVRELMHELLSQQGYQIHEASSGREALTLWPKLRSSVDLLVTDMVMPGGVGGDELADKLRREKPELKVIYCSGYSEAALSKNFHMAGHTDFLSKPFPPQKLLQSVRHCLDAPEES